MDKQRIKLNICGVDLTITTENSQDEALLAASTVEQSVKSAMAYNNRVSTTVAAIITALRYYDDYQNAKLESDNLRSQLKFYFDNAKRMRREIADLQKENSNLKEELKLMRVRLNPNSAAYDDIENSSKSFVTAKPSGRYIKKTLDDIVPEQQNFITFFEKEKK